jgi:hypothetical protein
VACSGLTFGCSQQPSAPPSPSEPSDVNPIVPSPEEPTRQVRATPSWASQLAEAEAEIDPVKARIQAWAALPAVGQEMVEVAVITVESVGIRGATVVDKMGDKTKDVPLATVHPIKSVEAALQARQGGELMRPGDVVLGYSWTTAAILGRVARVESAGDDSGKDEDNSEDEAPMKAGKTTVFFDWAGATKEAQLDHIEPARQGVVPLAFVGFPRSRGMSKGLVIALSQKHAWLQTSSGHVERHERSTLTPLELDNRQLGVGDRVRAYSWVGGFESGKITNIVEPGLRYSVALGDRRPEELHFFDTLIADR